MLFRRIIATLITCMACLLFYASPGFAQYWMETEPGFTLEPGNPDAPMLADQTPPLLAKASEACAVRFDALFWVRPGMSRFFTQEWDEPAQAMRYAEYHFIPDNPVPDTGFDLVRYEVDGMPLLIGIGQPDTEDAEWAPAQVVSLVEGPDGSVTELDRWELGAQYCSGIYIFDVLHDGSLCLIIPWATGAAGGGGVDVLWLSPAGSLTPFGPEGEYNSLWSQTGYVNLLDYDGDGVWEIETAFPLMYSVAGYSYKELLYFDRDSWSWVSGEQRFPDFYTRQNVFYRILFTTARELEKDPKKYLSRDPGWEGLYGFQMDGEWFSLDPFMNHETGEFDPTWLDSLAALFME